MPRTLLLVDDSVTIQRVIELTFSGEPIEVVAVGNGDEAIELVELTPPDIVLADVGMPGRNGYEVARHIKRTPRLAHIPVVLLTGTGDPVDQARAAEAGCDAVLMKPFEPQQVITRVRELLGTGDRQDELDRYFDRLDRELTALASAHAEPSMPRPVEPMPAPTAVLELPAPAPVPPRRLPSLADAFAALLEAEHHDNAATTWPESRRPSLLTDEAVEQIVEKVIRRLSETMVQNRVEEIVTRVAERLVRAEIERIKSSIT